MAPQGFEGVNQPTWEKRCRQEQSHAQACQSAVQQQTNRGAMRERERERTLGRNGGKNLEKIAAGGVSSGFTFDSSRFGKKKSAGSFISHF